MQTYKRASSPSVHLVKRRRRHSGCGRTRTFKTGMFRRRCMNCSPACANYFQIHARVLGVLFYYSFFIVETRRTQSPKCCRLRFHRVRCYA